MQYENGCGAARTAQCPGRSGARLLQRQQLLVLGLRLQQRLVPRGRLPRAHQAPESGRRSGRARAEQRPRSVRARLGERAGAAQAGGGRQRPLPLMVDLIEKRVADTLPR